VGRLGCTQAVSVSPFAGIGALTNLRELRVSGNKLSSLSAEVGSLRKLHRLIADNNLLTSIPGGSTISAHLTRNTMRLVLVLQGCVHRQHETIEQQQMPSSISQNDAMQLVSITMLRSGLSRTLLVYAPGASALKQRAGRTSFCSMRTRNCFGCEI